MRDGFHTARFERTGNHQRVHPHARHRSAVDVDRVHLARRHHLVHLLEDAVERESLWRIDFHADRELFFLQLFPEPALGLARRDRGRLGDRFHRHR
jgi:hypothetical protein